MSDSRKYLLGATATLVAARISARRGGELNGSAAVPALKDEFVAVYRELEAALETLGQGAAQKPYADKHRRGDENLMGD